MIHLTYKQFKEWQANWPVRHMGVPQVVNPEVLDIDMFITEFVFRCPICFQKQQVK